MARPGNYLYRRSGSTMWWVRFVYPEALWPTMGRRVERSLKTSDRQMAEAIAAPYIAAHKMIVLTAKHSRDGTACYSERLKMQPGMYGDAMSQGAKIVASPVQIIHFDAAGEIARIEPNRRETVQLPLSDDQSPEWQRLGLANGTPEAAPEDDVIHLERWIKQRGISGYLEREARAVWALFREITDSKPLADCDRDDGRKLVDALRAMGNARATVQKKVGHLCAAVELAIGERKLSYNPFSKVLWKEKVGDAGIRWPMPTHHMETVKRNLDTFNPDERLLWMLCATTGMRRGEACSIDAEHEEDGIRYVIVGTKTRASTRRVPLPDAVLPLLPAQITAPLFERDTRNLGRGLLRAMRKLKVTGKLVDIHALRHRAKDRLRMAECPEDMQDWILGHDEMTVSVDYGAGPPVRLTKKWIEKIGY